jgi:hypothetical protein
VQGPSAGALLLSILISNIDDRYQDLTKVLKSTIFWDMTSCSVVEVYKRFGGMHCLSLQSRTVIREIKVLFEPKYVVVRSSKMSVNFYQTTRHHIPGDSILRSRGYENAKSNSWNICFTKVLERKIPKLLYHICSKHKTVKLRR